MSDHEPQPRDGVVAWDNGDVVRKLLFIDGQQALEIEPYDSVVNATWSARSSIKPGELAQYAQNIGFPINDETKIVTCIGSTADMPVTLTIADLEEPWWLDESPLVQFMMDGNFQMTWRPPSEESEAPQIAIFGLLRDEQAAPYLLALIRGTAEITLGAHQDLSQLVRTELGS